MSYEKVRKIYDEFILEAKKLQHEIDDSENIVPKPFLKLYELLEIDRVVYYKPTVWYDWNTKTRAEFNEIVESYGLCAIERLGDWNILPFNTKELPYYPEHGLWSLVNVLTDGKLKYDVGDSYEIYDLDGYLENVRDEQMVIELFVNGLAKIDDIRTNGLKRATDLTEELQEQFSVENLLEDCKKFIFR